MWKDLQGNQEEVLLPIEKFGGYKTEVKERIEARVRLALRNKMNGEDHLDIYGEFEDERNDKVFARPNDLRENADAAFASRGRGPGRARKKIYIPVIGWKRKKAYRSAPVATQTRMEST